MEKTGKSTVVRSFESFQVGECHRSPVRVITPEQIATFAELTGDRNPIHLDPAFARDTVFRGPIVHGLFLASILAGMAYEEGLLGPNILALESSSEEYLAPVRPGQEIYGTVLIASKDASASRRCGRVLWDLRLFRVVPDQAEGELVLKAEWSSLVFKKRWLFP